jgi:lipoprotein-anchoring transpeptidase ErfK/SrfK
MRSLLSFVGIFLILGMGSAAQAPVVSDVLATQVMLDRAGFSPGEIDGRAGPNVSRALTAFQRAHGLATTGTIDAATWQRLIERVGTLQPLIAYSISDADVAGPFTASIPDDLMRQAGLSALGYRNPLEAIAEKFHTSPALLRRTNPGVGFDRAGVEILVPNVEPFELPRSDASTTGRGVSARGRGAVQNDRGVMIYVTKETSALTVEDAGGAVIFHAPVTSGSARDPLPIGEWEVTGTHRMPAFNYNPDLFWDADPTHSKARIAPGPNNPVGVVWIDLSKEHYGIHGTPEPSRIGHTQSHGCVRLTNWDAARVASWAQAGTRVVFR